MSPIPSLIFFEDLPTYLPTFLPTDLHFQSYMLRCYADHNKYNIRGIAHLRTNSKDDIFMQRRLLVDKVHTALDIFWFMVLNYMCRSLLVDLCRACFYLLLTQVTEELTALKIPYRLHPLRTENKTIRFLPFLCLAQLSPISCHDICYLFD